MPETPNITALLDAWSDGDPAALDELMPMVYDELQRIARRAFRSEGKDVTLQPTAVVNEVYLRLKGQRKVRWQSRKDFFAVAARLMRQVLVGHARRRKLLKRGGQVVKVPFDEILGLVESRAPGLIALDDALDGLSQLAPRQSQVVELKIFGGLTLKEIADALQVSRSTVHREWNASLLWLRRELGTEYEGAATPRGLVKARSDDTIDVIGQLRRDWGEDSNTERVLEVVTSLFDDASHFSAAGVCTHLKELPTREVYKALLYLASERSDLLRLAVLLPDNQEGIDLPLENVRQHLVRGAPLLHPGSGAAIEHPDEVVVRFFPTRRMAELLKEVGAP